MSSVHFAMAIEAWRNTRAEFEIVREAAYVKALDATNGKLLNRRGEKAGIDTYSLFIGPAIRAYAYASEELIEHWSTVPRITYAEFERQTLESPPDWPDQ
jgi:hypothetical protein